MRETLELKVDRAASREGRLLSDPQIGPIPGIIYGGGVTPARAGGRAHARPASCTGALAANLVMLELSGKKTRVIPVRSNSIRSPTAPSHRFPALTPGGRISLDIPVRFRGKRIRRA